MTSFSEHMLLLGYRTTVALRGIDNNKGENTTTFHFTGKVRHGTSIKRLYCWLVCDAEISSAIKLINFFLASTCSA